MNNTGRFATIIVALALAAGGYFMGQKPITVQTQGGAANNPIVNNGISVQGIGKVFAAPDVFIISLGVTEKAMTTKDAFRNASDKIAQINEVLEKNGVDKKDIQTSNISLYPNYEYSYSKSEQRGYSANQTLEVKVKKIENAGTILEQASAISGVQIQNTSYDIDNKEAVYEQARKLAFEKAEAKATQLASLAKVSLGEVSSISESINTGYPIYAQNFARDMVNSAVSEAKTTEIQPGQLEITTTVNVLYGIK